MKKYYDISLDLGTNSIGWAAISRDFKLVRKGGKNLWGTLLFKEGQSSQNCRTFRSARRRYERRKERIELLQMLLAEEIMKTDECFFKRLETSYLLNKNIDKVTGRENKYNLFCGNYTDKNYYKNFKTIYHLRKFLCETDEQADIRLIYLALHHIIKYRGNFLYEEEKIIVSGKGIKDKLNSVITDFGDLLGDNFNIDVDEYCKKLSDKKVRISRSDRAKLLKELGGGSNLSELIAKLILGLKGNLKKAFGGENSEIKELQFGTDTFEDEMEKISAEYGEEVADFLYAVHKVYTEYSFVDILGEGNDSISEAMIKRYEKHERDLNLLKSLLKPYSDLYDDMFISKRKGVRSEKANYTNYVKTSTRRTRYKKGAKRDEFYKYVKSVLEKIPDSVEKQKILSDIELEIFMPKINDVSNGAIPHQINKNELEKILEKQGKYYPVLKDKTKEITSLLTFRRPYSVGPLKGKFSWVEQIVNERVFPWNFNELVNVDEANKKFIAKMVGKDAFTNTSVLPLKSITYQKYAVLNELNNIRYKSKPLDVKTKQDIYNDLILKKATVTRIDIAQYIKNHCGMECNADLDLSGFADDKKLIANMKTYREFKTVLGDFFNECDIQIYDKAVEILTVFTDQTSKKRMLKSEIGKKYGDYVEKLAKKSYSGWGKFSKELLTETFTNEATKRNIIDLLYETDKNFMSIIYDDSFGIKEQTVSKVKEIKELSYNDVIDGLYASPAVKKVVWLASKLVAEIIKIIGCEPEHIFVESTRTVNEKKRTKSRYDKLNELYKTIKYEVKYYDKENARFIENNKDTGKLDDEKVYLYLLQCGRCMYTGQKLSLDQLNQYEVDHIVPRCYVKDDSIENKALVIRDANQRKGSLALSTEIIERQKDFWQFLCDKKLISKKKYFNLHKTEWTESDVNGFINRQLTETSQINKNFAGIMESVYPEIRVLPVKAGLVSELRHMHTDLDPVKHGNFFKLRDLNDYHHAKDAYLVGVLGLFTNEYFRAQTEVSVAIKRLIESGIPNAKETHELVNKRYGLIIDGLISGQYTCVDENGEEVSSGIAYNNMLSVMDRNDISVVHKKEFDGEPNFYDQTIYGKDSNKTLISRKYAYDCNGNKVQLDPYLYGGYWREKQAYYLKVNYDDKNKRQMKLIGIPVLWAKRYEKDENAIKNYLEEEGYKNAKICGRPVRKFQLINLKGQNVRITSDSEVNNATQLIVDVKYHQLLKYIEKNDMDKAEKLIDFDQLCLSFVEEYVDKLERFYPLFVRIKEKIKDFINNGFAKLVPQDKCKYISNLLIVTAKGRVDMPKNWGGGSVWGRLSGVSIIPDQVEWIDQSLTGYYVKKIAVKD